jgi:hypothetical protein
MFRTNIALYYNKFNRLWADPILRQKEAITLQPASCQWPQRRFWCLITEGVVVVSPRVTQSLAVTLITWPNLYDFPTSRYLLSSWDPP